MFKKIKNLSTIIITGIFILLPMFAQAQTQQNVFDRARGKLNIIGGITEFGTTAETGDVGLYDKIATVVNIVLGFAGILAMIYVIYAGIKWISAQGNEEEVKTAKRIIRDAVIGIAVIFLAYVAVNFVISEAVNIFTTAK
jgi:hypothetical protein